MKVGEEELSGIEKFRSVIVIAGGQISKALRRNCLTGPPQPPGIRFKGAKRPARPAGARLSDFWGKGSYQSWRYIKRSGQLDSYTRGVILVLLISSVSIFISTIAATSSHAMLMIALRRDTKRWDPYAAVSFDGLEQSYK